MLGVVEAEEDEDAPEVSSVAVLTDSLAIICNKCCLERGITYNVGSFECFPNRQ